jgi:hypothetical protein
MWTSKTVKEKVAVEEETTPKPPTCDEDDKAKVKEEAETEKTPKAKKVSKTLEVDER